MIAPPDLDDLPGLLRHQDAGSRPLFAVDEASLDGFLASQEHNVAEFVRATGFRAAPAQLALLPGSGGLAGAVVGMGAAGSGARSLPWTYGDLPRALPEGSAWHLAGAHDAAAATLGWCLGSYAFGRYRRSSRAPAALVVPSGSEQALAAAVATHWVRDLINTPAADLGPADLLAAAGRMAASEGASFEKVEGERLRDAFPAVAAVGGGSPRDPGVGILRWEGDPQGPLIALCGKGVCFDTGGLDLKPSAAMLRMKKDMAGAAVVLGLSLMIMRSRLPVRLLTLVGAVENSVSGAAFRPLDVLRTRAGVSVEIGNTDAEGRLVLADLLTYAGEHAPAMLVDCATLTGAARVALGPDLPALFSNDDDLARSVIDAGLAEHDPVWQLPLHHGYDSWLDSQVADLNNVATKPLAGAVVAALFLSRFVPPAVPWVHLDLYGWNDSRRPGRPEGGEAQAMRALHAGITNLFPRMRNETNVQ